MTVTDNDEEQTQATEVDGSDEDDHDAQEIALGTALGALLLAHLLPGPSAFLSGTKSWDDQVEAAIGPTLQGFLQRSALDIAAESGQPGASVTALVQAAETYPVALAWVQENSLQTLQNLTDDHVDDDNTAQAALSAAEGLARGAAVYSKSEVREQTVGKLGAVYKIWRSHHDARVRPAHIDLDGDQVPYDSTFHVGGIPIRYPGDPKAPIDLTANCRCHLVYRLKPKDGDYGLVSSIEHDFDEALHPRGGDGKFIEKGDHVIVNDGQGHKAEGIVEGFQEDGTQVRLNSGRLIAVPHTYISQTPTAEATLGSSKTFEKISGEPYARLISDNNKVKLNADQQTALERWTNGKGGVRHIQHGTVSDKTKASFDSTMNVLPKVSQHPVYRGVGGEAADFQSSLRVGDKLKLGEPVSSSIDPARSYGPNIYKIEGSPASYIGNKASHHSYEKEAVIPPGSFEVTKVETTTLSRRGKKEVVHVVTIRDTTAEKTRSYLPTDGTHFSLEKEV